MSRVPNNIRKIRRSKNLSQIQLAEMLGTSQSQVQKLEMGDRRLTVDWLSRLAKVFNCQLGDLIDLNALGMVQAEAGQEPGFAKEPGVQPDFYQTGIDTVPLYGQSNQTGTIILTPQKHLGVVLPHPKQKNVAGAFAIYCTGNDMAPRYRHGEIVYAVPAQDLATHDDVVIALKNGTGLLAEYIETDAETRAVTCRMASNAAAVVFQGKNIIAIHKVVGRG